MFKFIFRRFLEAIPVLFIVATLTFFMAKSAPGGPFDSEKPPPPEVLKKLNEYYGFDKPLYQQYFRYLGNLLKGDLGPSLKYPGWTVKELIGQFFPVSLELGFYAITIALTIGITLGLIASLRPNTFLDHIPMSLATLGMCMPPFVLGPLFALIFAIWLGLFNSSGWDSNSDRVLPSLILGIYFAASITRLTRGGMLEILSQDFIRTARAKGASSKRILLKHALKGGLLPVITFLGPAIARLLTGSFVIEMIFNVPGLGRKFVESAFNRDYMLLLGVVLLYATLIITLNLIVDIIQVWLNPKLKFE